MEGNRGIGRGGMAIVSMAAAVLLAVLLSLSARPADASSPTVIEGERLRPHSDAGKVVSPRGASGGEALVFYRNGAASGQFSGAADRLVVRARGDECRGAPRMVVKLDGERVMSRLVRAGAWRDYGKAVEVPRGAHRVTVAFTNDYYRSPRCDRDLRVDRVSLSRPAPEPGYDFGLIGNSGDRLQEERSAGIETKVVSLSWRAFYPEEGQKNRRYIERKREELHTLREAGFKVILSPGYHDTPRWVHENYADSYYVNQYGQRWEGDTFVGGTPMDNGDANLVFNDELRGAAASYLEEIFSELGTDFYAVRAGGGRYGELTYPPARYAGKSNLYWAYDASAAEENPVPGWEPGDDSPNAEAERFADWYLDSLVAYQNWQVDTLRRHYGGRIMMLYPSWGLRPGQLDRATETNLSGSTSAERNGEVQRGFAFARQVAALDDPGVVVTTTWLDAPTRWSGPGNPTPVEYLSGLAKGHPLSLEVYGENTGQGDARTMDFTASQMQRYGLLGMAWYREEELFSGGYASLKDYRRTIEESRDR